MSLAEIATRATYAGRLAIERRAVAGATRDRADRAQRWRPLVESRKRSAPPRFFPALDARDEMRALFASGAEYGSQGAAARVAADAAKCHRFEFFGERFTYGAEIDWHADPVSGRAWPKVYHADVPIHQGGAAIGDVKYVWELNRHQFLIDLGKAYWLYDDEDAATAIYRIVRHWIEQNPYGMGVSWSCALEPAFRAWSWIWAYQYCVPHRGLEDSMHALWLDGFHDHGRFLYRHLEYYASPYNHLIGEASALYALGILFPEMPEADRWRARARRVLEATLHRQFHADGGSVEQSTFYLHATLGFYLLSAELGAANDDSFPPAVHDAIERGIAFSMALQQPDGRVPSIGGADDGKSIRLEHLPFWDFRAFQAFGAVRYGRADFRAAAGEFHEDALWLTGPAGRQRFLAMAAATPATQTALRASGYYVLRSAWSSDADYLCFDCGEQAAGLRTDDVPSAAHGHADCLSLILWLRGQPVLVDPGFYCYNGDPTWEVHFRRTRAHNTATIDGDDQSRHVHKMAWTRVFTPRLEAWLPAQAAVGGSHDGYLRTRGVIHRRAVCLHESGCCVICDQFTGIGTRAVTLNYQFAPGSARIAGASAVLFDTAELAWTASVGVTGRLRCGEEGPEGGWIAPSLGVRAAAPRLTLDLSIHEIATVLSVVVPRRAHEATRTSVTTATPQLLAIEIRGGTSPATSVALQLKGAAVTAEDLIGCLRIAPCPPARTASDARDAVGTVGTRIGA